MQDKRVIGVDLDDVLLDFNETLCHYHNEKYATNYRRSDLVTYYLETVWACPREEAISRVKEFYFSDVHRSAPPVAGAVQGVSALRRLGPITIVTSKPDSLHELTREWLETNFPGMIDSVYFTNHFMEGSAPSRTKRDVCDELGIDLFVEDALHHAIDIVSPRRDVFLLDSPWNQGETPEGVRRVHSWQEIVDLLG